MPVKLGIIGTGKMASRIMPHMARVKEFSITALLDVLPQATAAFNEKHGLKAATFTDAKAFFARSGIEAVYIATPPAGHLPMTAQAAAAGKHVLCEKPMALTLDEGTRMVDACRKAGVILNIGYMMRFQVYHQRIREEVEKGTIGRVVRVGAERTCYFEPSTIAGWFSDPKQSGGGAFTDLGCHVLDLVCYLAQGRVKRVRMLANRFFPGPGEVEHSGMAAVEFDNGVLGSAYATWACPLHDDLVQVYGDKGALIAQRTVGPYPDGALTIYQPDQPPQVIKLDYVPHYELELRHFAGCIRGGSPSKVVSGETVLESERARFLAYANDKE